MTIDRSIPSFYCCYLLRSTVRHGSLYIGSTPNPVRRLRQHNGLAKGGAVRTNRDSLRPWEMSCIVTGFPSSIAALQFEWAWQNPHITLHIPPSLRISYSTQKKRSGHQRRPRPSIQSALSNLKLLLSVPSFSRWPLEVQFFSPDVHKAWSKWSQKIGEPLRDSLPIITHFPSESNLHEEEPENHGIKSVNITHEKTKPHVEKGRRIFHPDMDESCTICKGTLLHDSGLHTICPNISCDAITHMTCLSQHFLQSEKMGGEALLPIKGQCPACKTEIHWKDVMVELSLRIRGQKLIDRLLKVKRGKRGKGVAVSEMVVGSDDEEDEEDEEEEEDEEDDGFKNYLDSDDSDTTSIISTSSNQPRKRKNNLYVATKPTLITVIEDSDREEGDE
ncbi:hypothetical protein MFRU_038g00650 [Monilinia fructicola]|nr:hypothetical protein MFRU_038g00650 [Monilinia fructicola]